MPGTSLFTARLVVDISVGLVGITTSRYLDVLLGTPKSDLWKPRDNLHRNVTRTVRRLPKLATKQIELTCQENGPSTLLHHVRRRTCLNDT